MPVSSIRQISSACGGICTLAYDNAAWQPAGRESSAFVSIVCHQCLCKISLTFSTICKLEWSKWPCAAVAPSVTVSSGGISVSGGRRPRPWAGRSRSDGVCYLDLHLASSPWPSELPFVGDVRALALAASRQTTSRLSKLLMVPLCPKNMQGSDWKRRKAGAHMSICYYGTPLVQPCQSPAATQQTTKVATYWLLTGGCPQAGSVDS